MIWAPAFFKHNNSFVVSNFERFFSTTWTIFNTKYHVLYSSNLYLPLQIDQSLQRKNYLLPTQTCSWLGLISGLFIFFRFVYFFFWFVYFFSGLLVCLCFFLCKARHSTVKFEILNFILFSYLRSLSRILILQKSLKKKNIYIYI